MTNSLVLDEIAFRSTPTNNVRPLTRDLSRFRDDHNLPIHRVRVGLGSYFVYAIGAWRMYSVFYLLRPPTRYLDG